MKRIIRTWCAGLLAVVLTASPVFAYAEQSVRIPTSVEKIKTPEMPEPVELTTYCENDGRLAYLDGDYTLYFGDRVDFAAVDWVNFLEAVEIMPDNTAVTSKEGHIYQQNGVVARKDGVSMSYTNSGFPKAVWITGEDDYFSSGQKDAWSTVYWRHVIVKTECGELPVWFISNITCSYPYGEEIRSISVDYYNNKRNTVQGYTITYAVSDTELYSIRYNEYDRVVRGYYHDGRRTLEYVYCPEKTQYLWRDTETEKYVRSSKLRKPESFPSPRVR